MSGPAGSGPAAGGGSRQVGRGEQSGARELTSSDRARHQLDSIHQSATVARRIVARGRQAWDDDVILQRAGEATLIRIGEAAKQVEQLDPRYVPRTSAVPWDDMKRTRDFLAHNHDRVDPNMVWNTLARDVPQMHRELVAWRRDRDVHASTPERLGPSRWRER